MKRKDIIKNLKGVNSLWQVNSYTTEFITFNMDKLSKKDKKALARVIKKMNLQIIPF